MKEQILSAIFSHQKIVFPSEVVAQFWMQYALFHGEKRCLWSDHILAWDSFQEQILSSLLCDMDMKTSARTLHRLLFAATLDYQNPLLAPCIAELSSDSDASQLLICRVAALLPRLPYLLHYASFPAALSSSFNELYVRYRSYLDAASAYESFYQLYDTERAGLPEDENNTIATTRLFFPEVIGDYDMFFPTGNNEERAGVSVTNAFPRKFSVPSDYAPVVRRRYALIHDEILDIARRIRQLLLDGVNPMDIALTVGQLRTLRHMIEPLFVRYQIPFHVHQSRSLIDYPFGLLVSLFVRASSYDFSHAVLQELMLHPQLVWNATAMDELFQADDENEKGRHARSDRLYHAFPAPLYHAVRSVVSSASFDELRVNLARFVSRYLNINYWSEEQRDAYHYAFELLQQLVIVAERSRMSPANPFSFYFVLMQQSNYASRNYLSAVAIYNYPQSGGIYPHHHFVANLTQSTTSISHNPWSMFGDHFRHNYQLHEQQITDNMLLLYTHSGKHVYCSYSEQHQHGDIQTPALLFLLPSTPDVVPAVPIAHDARPLPAEQCGGRSYLLHCRPTHIARFNRKRIHSELLRSQIQESCAGPEQKITLSYQALMDLIVCPYRFYTDRILRLVPHAPEYQDDLTRRIGILQHRIMRALFFESQNISRSLGDAYEQVHTTQIISDTWEKEKRYFSSIEQALVLSVVPVQCAAAFLEISTSYPQYFVFSLEQKYSACTKQGVNLVGVVDLLLSKEHTDAVHAVLVDYKRKRMNMPDGVASELQLAFYSELLGLCNIEIFEAGYYYFDEKSLKRSARVADNIVLYPELRQEIQAQCIECVRRLRTGDFTLPNPDGCCENCKNRQLCRSKFSIQS